MLKVPERKEAFRFLEMGYRVEDQFGREIRLRTGPDGKKGLLVAPDNKKTHGTINHYDAPFPDRFADPLVMPDPSDKVDAKVDHSTISRRVTVHSQFSPPVEIARSHAANSLMLGYTVTDQDGYDLTIETREDGSKRVARAESLPRTDSQWKVKSHDVSTCKILNCGHPAHYPVLRDSRNYGSEVAGAAPNGNEATIIKADGCEMGTLSFMDYAAERDARAAHGVANFHQFGNAFREQVSDYNLEHAHINRDSPPTAPCTLGRGSVAPYSTVCDYESPGKPFHPIELQVQAY